MSDRKVYATVEGTIMVPVRVKRSVCVLVDEDASSKRAIESAAAGAQGGDFWNLVYANDIELIDCLDAIDESITTVDEANFAVDNVQIEDSK